MKCSVAIATYNGEKYIREQLLSILNQTVPVDEIVVSDDGSNDNTLNIIKEFHDSRIVIYEESHLGVKQNFGNAISKTTGDIIFLADQDDVWEKDKVKIIKNFFQKEKNTLIVHNASIVNEELKDIKPYDIYSWRKSGRGFLKNIIKNSYVGCCMAFKKELKKYILPIPDNIEMHDQWIGLINEKKLGKTLFIPDKLIKYRRHNDNTSEMKHHSLIVMIKNRTFIIKELLRRL